MDLLNTLNKLNIFTKHEERLKMFGLVCWSYAKWCILIIRITVPLVDHSVVKVSVLALPYKTTPSFVEIFSGLKMLTCSPQLTRSRFAFINRRTLCACVKKKTKRKKENKWKEEIQFCNSYSVFFFFWCKTYCENFVIFFFFFFSRFHPLSEHYINLLLKYLKYFHTLIRLLLTIYFSKVNWLLNQSI